MIFYSVKKDFTYNDGLTSTKYLAQPSAIISGHNSLSKYIYCDTVSDYVRLGRALEVNNMVSLLTHLPESSIRSYPGFPRELGITNAGEYERNLRISGLAKADDTFLQQRKETLKKQISRINKNKIHIALINGLGAGIGDTVAGLTALRNACNLIAGNHKHVTMDVIIGNKLHARLSDIYNGTDIIGRVRTLPITLYDLLRYDAFFDTGGLAHRRDFSKLPMVDFFHKVLGMDYRKMPGKFKRNHIDIDGDINPALMESFAWLRAQGKKLLLFHPTASTDLRSIPNSEIPRIIDDLASTGRYQIISATPIDYSHDNLTDLSNQSRKLSDLIFIIRNMDGILTVDTCIYHIADCFDIPTIVWFTSIEPELRVKYYPYVKGVLLDGARELDLYSRHISKPGDNLEPVYRLWGGVDINKSLKDLDKLHAARMRTSSQRLIEAGELKNV